MSSSYYTHPHNSDRESVRVDDVRVITGYLAGFLADDDGRFPVVATIVATAPDEDQARAAGQALAESLRVAIGRPDRDLSICRNPRLQAQYPETAASHKRAVAATLAWADELRARGWAIESKTT